MRKYFKHSMILLLMLTIWPLRPALTAQAVPVLPDSSPTVQMLYPNVAGAFIELQVEPFRPGLWTRIQWQDAAGGWHDIDGWQGAFNPDQRVLWYVGEEHLGDGPFRWLVYESQGGALLAASVSFNLPSGAGEVLHVALSLPTAVSVSDDGQMPKVEPVVETAVSTPIPGGLLGQYYNFNGQIPPTNPFQEANLVLTRVDETVDFFWPLGGEESPDPAVHNDLFAIRWTGMVYAPVTGTFTFGTSHDDGVRLYVNDTLLYEDWQDGETREVQGSITLTGGVWYPIKLEFWEYIWTAEIYLFWSYPGQTKSIIQSPFLTTKSPSVEAGFAPLEKTITVDAQAGWIDTGFQVESGNQVEIVYLSGLWTSGGDHALHDANGTAQNYICSQVMPAAECIEPVPDAVKGALVARIGNASPFLIGNGTVFNATSHGPLMLSMNDTNLAYDLLDNIGSIVVRVSVTNLASGHVVTTTSSLLEVPIGSYLSDNFDDSTYDGSFNSTIWTATNGCADAAQSDNVITFQSFCDLTAQPMSVPFDELGLYEAQVQIASDHNGTTVVTQEIYYFTDDLPGETWWITCGLRAEDTGASTFLQIFDKGQNGDDWLVTSPAEYDRWYTIRLEVDRSTMTFSCFVDDNQLLGSVIPQGTDLLREARFDLILEAFRSSEAFATTSVNYIRFTDSSRNEPEETAWIINPDNNHAYRMIRCGSWQVCNKAAATQDAYLVTIKSESEQTWLSETFGESALFWIGFTDQDSEGDWQWSNGETVNYTNWGQGEPNDAWACGEDFGVMNWEQPRKWNDLGPCLPEWEFVNWAIIERVP